MKVFLWSILPVLLASAQDGGKTHCDGKTCHDCIASGPDCGWCLAESFGDKMFDDKRYKRCNKPADLNRYGCDPANIISPDHNETVLRNQPPQDSSKTQNAIQLSPQEINVKIRPNKPFKFNLVYKQAQNYPVDLYFVMDLSQSMADDKAKLAELGSKLATEMLTITSDVKLGFGSFVDKKALPFVSIIPAKLLEPCDRCVAPYSFKNHLRLTDQHKNFTDGVNEASNSGNLDGPEGGFDALMQAIVCKENIGWRNVSRKLVVLSTDERFHAAGDGLLAGVVTPNDGKCHMDTSNYYTESLNQDYPSISQLAQKIAETSVSVIFAVTESQIPLYAQLSKFIKGSVVGELKNDSSNIVELVRNNYNKIASRIEMKSDAPDEVKVTFKTNCGSTSPSGGTYQTFCDDVHIGQTINYEVVIEVPTCPSDRGLWKKSFNIYPQGLNERLTVHLDMQCECTCEAEANEVKNSAKCNHTGTYECGACTCDPDFYGRTCECGGKTGVVITDLDSRCKMTNTSQECEGNGECNCGECICYTIASDRTKRLRYSGLYCECNDFSCDYFEGELCGGDKRGKCMCGQCICNQGYDGSNCYCSLTTDDCISKSGLMCNGQGRCICGRCECARGSNYRGPTCEDCPTCPGRCEILEPDVKAALEMDKKKEECTNCTGNMQLVDHNVDDNPNLNWRLCRYIDEDNCRVFFIYEYSSDKVQIQRQRECPQPFKAGIWIPVLIIAVVLIGLLLLCIWRLCVYIYDKREVARFQKELDQANWGTDLNPIFKPATSTYKNPNKI